MNTFHKIGVIGGGAWGTALAQTVAKTGPQVTIWARETEVVQSINDRCENSLFLPGVALDPAIHATSDLGELASAEMVLIVTPAQHMRATLKDFACHLRVGSPLVLCSKGIEQGSLKLMSEVLAETIPNARSAVLSGPSFAADVARGLPTAVTLACADRGLGEDIIATIGSASFRPYYAPDVIGAEVGGAVKNVLAIAAGIVDGKALGRSAHAALISRGFAEMTRLGVALGGKAETLAGLCGLGDLILTCSSPQSRNMSCGLALGRGESLETIMVQRNSVTEGVASAPAVVALARRHGVEMPICEAVNSVVSGAGTVDEAIAALLSRPFTSENA
ncbi:glycerol-3-phosphate dehydrogenase [NAD(P)+] [Marinicauda pacifica]|uniref:Glycerol-3-phosphate dehydrogenase [NAD(P)+] n=1 Tax=Marinicauda pacifica TaxID=1133559 RepID=A0A4S2HC68_9PROT|nr:MULTISPECIES: NAD(P)H-dependent glycerol-3-phosphate dehydrogenase [Marinicauda]TGY93268.1 NAD(P)-dependent glycerol-3-phosphate dehydrogenase [Marinicauda pacifica]GGE44261.1 glycerol-3-phosphate dehydrogenase [NAD(P)+] [Marinicauda pacifica]